MISASVHLLQVPVISHVGSPNSLLTDLPASLLAFTASLPHPTFRSSLLKLGQVMSLYWSKSTLMRDIDSICLFQPPPRSPDSHVPCHLLSVPLQTRHALSTVSCFLFSSHRMLFPRYLLLLLLFVFA